MIGNPHTLRTCIEHCPLLHALSIKKYFSLEQHTQSCPRGACRISGVYDLTEGVAWCAFLREQRTAWIRPHLLPTFVPCPNLFDSESRIEECPRRFRASGMYVVTAGTAHRAILRGRRTIRSCPPYFISIGGAY